MNFILMVTGPAYGTQQSSSALQFARALLSTEKHQLTGIFFYQEGVHNANRFSSPASDEFNLIQAWQSVSIKHGIRLYVCVSASLRRGIIDHDGARRFEFSDYNLADGFLLSGLNELAQAALSCDRMVQF